MYKFLILFFFIFILFSVKTYSVSAQACPPENDCLCGTTGYPACCDVEGPGGYNCGGRGTGTPPPSEGIPVTPCGAPQNVNCPANTSCVPNSTYSCNPYNVDYNSSTSSVFDGPNGNAVCRLGNAQTSDRSCNAWFCGYTVTTYACCPAGSVSMHYYTQPADYQVSVNPCEGGQRYNCSPDIFVSYVENGWRCGTTPRDEDGERYPIYTGTKTCRPQQVKVNVCVPNCTVTAPSTPTLLSPANGSTVSTCRFKCEVQL